MSKIKQVDLIDSNLEGTKAQVFRFFKNYSFKIASYRCGKYTTVSFISKSIKGNSKLSVTLKADNAYQKRIFSIDNVWKKFELSLENEDCLGLVDVYVEYIGESKYQDISIDLFQAENYLFSTSPILPKISLPASNNSTGTCSKREADRISINMEKYEGNFDSNKCTLILDFNLIPETKQITKNVFLPLFSFYSKNDESEISIGISGLHKSKIVIRIQKKNTDDIFFVSKYTMSNDDTFIAAVFDYGEISIFINGFICLIYKYYRDINFDKCYIGSSYLNQHESINGLIRKVIHYEYSLSYIQLVKIYSNLIENDNQHVLNYMKKYFKFGFLNDDEDIVLNDLLVLESYSYVIQKLKNFVPKIYEEFPPKKIFTEDDIRNCLYQFMYETGNVIFDRESYSKIGRTDILIKHPTKDNIYHNYRIEFKIWGRDGYKESPDQPIKYMMEDEKLGCFIMIDRRKTSSIDDFEEIVRSNKSFPCISIKELPLIDFNIPYFVSFHKDSRFKSPRMMINLYISIPE